MDTALQYLTTAGHYALLVLLAAVAGLLVLAPATKTDWDNRALAYAQKFLRYLYGICAALLPSALKGLPPLPLDETADEEIAP